ncbi:isochorismatase family protein [Oceanobacillus kimchii]|uniref:isochorismatase n=1 Tax=Oceanobacillus kimchii TaxID=746691 RepID=A0ABQ5TH94_9BACI|nr:isochorismatase family protein [Oceanobacillus kimchii]GLO65400.1 isochorismatase [Oceanobacillus kimchii]
MSIPSIASYTLPTENELPKSKVDWKAEASRSVLLIHDMQQYFLDFYGQDSPLIQQLIKNISKIKETCTKLGIPTVYTAQPGDQNQEDRALLTDFWGPGLDDDIEQTKITDQLAPTEDDIVQTKWRYSAFKKSQLLEWMQENGKDQLIICGVYANIGCIVTAVEAFMSDIQPFIVADAMADFSKEQHEEALIFGAGRCARPLMMKQLIEDISSENTITTSSIKAQVAEMLEMSPDQLNVQDDLIESGLDSIRIMMLAENWNSEGIDISFIELIESPKLESWYQKLVSEYETIQVK